VATPIKIRNLVAPAGGLLVVTGPANIKWIVVLNSSAATAFVQLFNAVSGITLGTTTPDMELEVGAGLMVSIPFPYDGCLFSAGISAASTTAEGGNVASATGVEVFIGV
jgi:hypothetical protein